MFCFFAEGVLIHQITLFSKMSISLVVHATLFGDKCFSPFVVGSTIHEAINFTKPTLRCLNESSLTSFKNTKSLENVDFKLFQI